MSAESDEPEWEHKVHGVNLLSGKEPILQKIVFELRYRRGYYYLDKCGRLIVAIMDQSPEWTTDPGNPNPQGASLISLANSCVLSVNTRKMDLALEIPIGGDPLTQDGVEQFTNQVEQTTAIVLDQLGIEEFDRIGCRLWYIFPSDSQEETENWLKSLACYSVTPALIEAFGRNIEAMGVSIVIAGEECNYRIAFNGVQRAATLDVGKNVLNVRTKDLSMDQRQFLIQQEKTKARIRRAPDFPAMIDIDAYVENPEILDPSDFVGKTYNESLNRLRKAIGK